MSFIITVWDHTPTVTGNEDDALGALIGCPHAADLSGACRRDSFSRSPRFVSLQMEIRDP